MLHKKSILYNRQIAELYDKHRRCLIKHASGEVEVLKHATRMSLGYKKCTKLLESAKISTNDIVLNCFAGPGALVRLCSLLKPRLLIASDILYPGWMTTKKLWTYAAPDAFSMWAHDLEKLTRKNNYKLDHRFLYKWIYGIQTPHLSDKLMLSYLILHLDKSLRV